MAITVENTNEVVRGFQKILNEFSDPASRRRIASAGAPIVINAIQNVSPVSKKKHFRYNTAKLINSIRAPKGKGRISNTYLSENLKNSVISLADRRKKYAKSPAIVIAPLYSRSKAKVIGKGKIIDGYYAHMVYGSAEAYQKKVLIKGLEFSKTAASTTMIREAIKILNEQKQKTGL